MPPTELVEQTPDADPAPSAAPPTPEGAAPATPSRARTAVLVLVAVSAIWGSTFPLIKDTLTRVPAPDFLFLRFLLAAAALTLARPGWVTRMSRGTAARGLVIGLLLGAGQLLQTCGLALTSAAVSGFLTGLYVVLTPLLAALVLRRRVHPAVWAAVALSTAGLAVLSLGAAPAGPLAAAGGVAASGPAWLPGPGELLTVLSALMYAGQILCLGQWSRPGETYALTVLQMLVTAGMCLPAALAGGLTVPSTPGDLVVLGYTGVIAAAVAIGLQSWAQAHLPATRAAIVMTFEPVWAGAFAVAAGEALTGRLLLGGGLAVAAMFLAELGPAGRPLLRRRRHRP